MVMDANSQNKNLRSAAARPKDTSHRLRSSTNYSAKVSSGSRSDNEESSVSSVKMDTAPRRKIQGSLEGLESAKSAYLQPNGAGYDNKKYHQARYRDRSISLPQPRAGLAILPSNKRYSIMDNYSSKTLKDSSSDRLNSIVELNMMFK